MEMDRDLIRCILEEAAKKLDERPLQIQIKGHKTCTVDYHVKLCHEAGLIHAAVGAIIVLLESLTWYGHLVLAKLRKGSTLDDAIV